MQKDEFELHENSTALDCFEALVTPFLMGKVAFETNRYYKQVIEKEMLSSRTSRWSDTTADEMYVFIAITMLMTRNKKLEIAEYWSTDPYLHSPIFGQLMSRNRYQILLRFIHFCNNENQIPNDSLFKIDMVFQSIRKNFKDILVPFKNLVIDESLMLWKGRLSFKQFIRTKRHRFGIKFFVLCDVETDFILDIIIYTGKSTKIVSSDLNLGQSGAIVKTLMHKYFNKGHCLFTDNWYTSPILSTYLHKKKTNSCGTVRKNRRGMPQLKSKLMIGKTESQYTNKMMVLKWMDRREVYMLTTFHNNNLSATEKNNRNGEPIFKPECVLKYNQSMGSVDKTDMLLSSIECVRKTIKWYKKVYFHLIDLSLLNSYSVYSTITGKKIPLAQFQLDLIKQIVEKYKTVHTSKRGRPTSTTTGPLRLVSRHFPSDVPSTTSGKFGRRKCVVCKINKKRTDTRYMCKICDVGLCPTHCFENFHTKK